MTAATCFIDRSAICIRIYLAAPRSRRSFRRCCYCSRCGRGGGSGSLSPCLPKECGVTRFPMCAATNWMVVCRIKATLRCCLRHLQQCKVRMRVLVK